MVVDLLVVRGEGASAGKRGPLTLPVPVFRGMNILNTRRTIGGVFRLSPNPVINDIVLYSLGYAAREHGIVLYAHSTLSNHQHTVFHDTHGRHPEFRRDLHALMARAVNQHRGESDAMWAPHRRSAVILYDTEALLDEIAYTIPNSCLHDLVEEPEDWPGVVSLVDDLARPGKIVRKPGCFFDPDGKMPDYVEVRFEKPAVLSHLTDDEYRAEVARRVRAKCDEARRQRRRSGRRVLGRRGVLAQPPKGTPTNRLARGSLNPIVACGLRSLRIAFLSWLVEFRKFHREARLAFERQQWRVEFPFGTYAHVLRYGVNCSAVGPPGLT